MGIKDIKLKIYKHRIENLEAQNKTLELAKREALVKRAELVQEIKRIDKQVKHRITSKYNRATELDKVEHFSVEMAKEIVAMGGETKAYYDILQLIERIEL